VTPIAEIYASHRGWAVSIVKRWMQGYLGGAAPAGMDVAEDIVQEAFIQLLQSTDLGDVRHPHAVVKQVCRWHFNTWVRTRTADKRDARKSASLNALLATNEDLDWPCARTNTEESALALLEIEEGLSVVSLALRKALLKHVFGDQEPGTVEYRTANQLAWRARKQIAAREKEMAAA
jgi:DNA-directed RNA polymerase specialized sigma24 family protein